MTHRPTPRQSAVVFVLTAETAIQVCLISFWSHSLVDNIFKMSTRTDGTFYFIYVFYITQM